MQKLVKLGYEYDAFEGVVDALTMETHHSKHLGTYVTNFNNLVEGTKFADMALEEILKDLNAVDENIRAGVRNNGGGIYNHNLYFEQFKKDVELKDGAFKDSVVATFGSVEAMIDALKTAGLGRFGSGWSWLVLDGSELKVISTANQDTPLELNQVAILGIDVWEHAYYLSYQNRRAEYLEKVWSVMDWDLIAKRYEDAK